MPSVIKFRHTILATTKHILILITSFIVHFASYYVEFPAREKMDILSPRKHTKLIQTQTPKRKKNNFIKKKFHKKINEKSRTNKNRKKQKTFEKLCYIKVCDILILN